MMMVRTIKARRKEKARRRLAYCIYRQSGLVKIKN
jgi:hypothetical protein